MKAMIKDNALLLVPFVNKENQYRDFTVLIANQPHSVLCILERWINAALQEEKVAMARTARAIMETPYWSHAQIEQLILEGDEGFREQAAAMVPTKVAIETWFLEHILYIGKEIPAALVADRRDKFVCLGFPFEMVQVVLHQGKARQVEGKSEVVVPNTVYACLHEAEVKLAKMEPLVTELLALTDELIKSTSVFPSAIESDHGFDATEWVKRLAKVTNALRSLPC